jgi:hypothetical protein
MPRNSNAGISSAFTRVQTQVRELLTRLRTEIRSAEMELSRLREEEAQLSALVGQRQTNGAKKASPVAAKRKSRIDWGAVLAQMPKQFKASDVRNVRGLKDKRSSEIFAAITRWIEASAVKRKDRGVYERVK